MCKALASESQIRFAPFGESKLTEVLQGSLGGNAIVLCIACLSRSDLIKVKITCRVQRTSFSMQHACAR